MSRGWEGAERKVEAELHQLALGADGLVQVLWREAGSDTILLELQL